MGLEDSLPRSWSADRAGGTSSVFASSVFPREINRTEFSRIRTWSTAQKQPEAGVEVPNGPPAGKDKFRFFCKFPGCQKAYSCRDGVRRHAKQQHADWLKQIDEDEGDRRGPYRPGKDRVCERWPAQKKASKGHHVAVSRGSQETLGEDEDPLCSVDLVATEAPGELRQASANSTDSSEAPAGSTATSLHADMARDEKPNATQKPAGHPTDTPWEEKPLRGCWSDAWCATNGPDAIPPLKRGASLTKHPSLQLKFVKREPLPGDATWSDLDQEAERDGTDASTVDDLGIVSESFLDSLWAES